MESGYIACGRTENALRAEINALRADREKRDAHACEMHCVRCIACGRADHSHLTCVLVCAALHRWVRQWAPEKDMTLVVDIILRLLMWGWREAHFGEFLTCLSYTKLGDVIVAGSRSGRIFVMSAQTGEKRLCNVAVDHSTTHTKLTTRQRRKSRANEVSHGEINCMAYSPSGDTVAVGYENGNVGIVQVTNGSVDSIDFTNYGSVDSIDFSPCGSQLAAACNDVDNDSYSVMIFSKAGSTGIFECQGGLRGHNYGGLYGCICEVEEYPQINPECPVIGHSIYGVSCLSWSTCGKWLACGGDDRKVHIYDAKTFQIKRVLTGGDSSISCVSFNPIVDVIAAGDSGGNVRLYDVLTGEVKRALSGHSDG
jgi:WD40 repeat protein